MPSVLRLRGAGHGVAAIASEQPGTSDERVLDRAVVENRVIPTFERDYGRLIFEAGLPAPIGVAFLRFVPGSLDEPAERILEPTEEPDFAIPTTS